MWIGTDVRLKVRKGVGSPRFDPIKWGKFDFDRVDCSGGICLDGLARFNSVDDIESICALHRFVL